jgi:pyridoxamine-phosphate oxidase
MNEFSSILAALRREYVSEPLSEGSVSTNPIEQFRSWFDEAVRAEQPDPEAMTLSTSTSTGAVSARIVLLKGFDPEGFVFYTNYQSRKSRELTENPSAALTFYWHSLNRQVRIEGTVERVSQAESEEYFATRPRGSRIGAWTSPQSEVIPNRESLESKLTEVEARFSEGPIPCPLFWGGFRLRPNYVEFWQGRENRLHDRIIYQADQKGSGDSYWRVARLAP